MDFFCSGIVGDRSKQTEVFAAVGDVKFPADPRDGVAFAHEKSVAIFAGRTGRTIAVCDAQNTLSAAIRNFKKYGVVSFVHLLGFQEIKVGRTFDFPLRVSLRLIAAHDPPIENVVRIQRETYAPDTLTL